MTTQAAQPGRLVARLLTPTARQGGLLFGVDMVTNIADYAFHIFLAWALTAEDFVTVQAVNALVLVIVTAFGVLQPVVARYTAAPPIAASLTAASESSAFPEARRGVFQLYFRQSLLLGAALLAAAWLLRAQLAAWLNLPTLVFGVTAVMFVPALTRPVVAGVLQGSERYVPFGLARTAFSVSRLALALVVVGLLSAHGATLFGSADVAVALLFPLAGLISLGVGLLFLGRDVWTRAARPAAGLVRAGWRLSLAALLAYGGYMILLNLDIIWVNRVFEAQRAATYAVAVVLRRILAVLPGVVLVILFPRIVSGVAAGRLPDRILLKAGLIIGGLGLAATAVFFLFGPLLTGLAAGGDYPQAAPLLGWMGLAMTGYGLAAVWLNLFLATRPWAFVIALWVAAAAQALALAAWHESPAQVTLVFLAFGWLTVLAGLGLYLFRLRPALQQEINRVAL